MMCLDCHEIPRGSPPEGAALLQVEKIAVFEDAGCILPQKLSDWAGFAGSTDS
jgi:hypothetical protein